MELWESGWSCLFSALEPLSAEELTRTIYIRGEALSVMQAINRMLVRLAYPRWANCVSGQTFSARPVEVSDDSAWPVRGIQSEGEDRRKQPAMMESEAVKR